MPLPDTMVPPENRHEGDDDENLDECERSPPGVGRLPPLRTSSRFRITSS